METKLNMVPEKLDRVTSAIDDSNSEYEQLLKLKPIYTIVSVFWTLLLFNLSIYYSNSLILQEAPCGSQEWLSLFRGQRHFSHVFTSCIVSERSASKKYGLVIYKGRTKVMATEGDNTVIAVHVDIFQQVDHFLYLGALITEDGRCEADTRTRLGMANYVLTELDHTWKCRAITTCT